MVKRMQHIGTFLPNAMGISLGGISPMCDCSSIHLQQIFFLRSIVTTHKTIDLVFHTQVCKLKRDMTHKTSVSASSIAFMHNEGREVIDETPVHSPATDCSRPASVGAPSQGAHDHSGTPGEQ